MALPTKTKAFRRTKDGKSIEAVEDSLPDSLQPSEVLIKIHAVSLNYRDVAMVEGTYPISVIERGVSCSDAAATVVAVGSSVSQYKEGDYVAPSFHVNLNTGREKLAAYNDALGGDVDGVLREYAIYNQKCLTKLPEHLPYEEGSTISCAGVTAWVALERLSKTRPIEYVLLEGTGGVSLFALLICIAAGITPIITSSSDEKLKQVKALGSSDRPVLGINYRTTPDIAEEVKKLTDGAGVDVVINNVGETSVQSNINALCNHDGTVSLVGFLGGFLDDSKKPNTTLPLMQKQAKMQGIGVGSTKDQQDLCEFLAKHKVSLKPLVDQVFKFEDAAEAFSHLSSGAHVGKVVIRV
ncbi:hypothetical protein MBLNU230_g3136t1 [Neophaeotheca triangularis]